MPLTYLDHAATTPMRPAAVEAMLPFLTERFANPSGSHRFARDARKAVDEARDDVADVLGVAPGEVVFTGGGTEGDNTVIGGVDGHHVCSAAEHHAVLHPVEARRGTVVDVDSSGHVDLDALAAAVERAPGEPVALVTVMSVNNEVGTVTDLAAVARVVRRHAPDALIHTDAVQAPCWLDVREVVAPHVDAMSLSGHKFGGPKGVGVLTVRRGRRVHPLLTGGGQERELRSGTHNVAGIVALAVALRETDSTRTAELARLAGLRRRLLDGLICAVEVAVTVPSERAVPGIVHVCFPGVESESLLYLLDEAKVCASAASACASGAMQRSHVLSAMGVDPDLSRGALRLSLGHTTTRDDIDRAVAAITAAVTRLRATPVWR